MDELYDEFERLNTEVSDLIKIEFLDKKDEQLSVFRSKGPLKDKYQQITRSEFFDEWRHCVVGSNIDLEAARLFPDLDAKNRRLADLRAKILVNEVQAFGFNNERITLRHILDMIEVVSEAQVLKNK